VKQLFGHLWTIGPSLRHRARAVVGAAGRAVVDDLIDPEVGALELQGALHRGPDSRAACAWRSTGSAAASTATTSSARRGPPSPRARLPAPGLRGADRLGEDFYHAGLTADVEAALRSPALAEYTRTCSWSATRSAAT
jgi:hypothetical protein